MHAIHDLWSFFILLALALSCRTAWTQACVTFAHKISKCFQGLGDSSEMEKGAHWDISNAASFKANKCGRRDCHLDLKWACAGWNRCDRFIHMFVCPFYLGKLIEDLVLFQEGCKVCCVPQPWLSMVSKQTKLPNMIIALLIWGLLMARPSLLLHLDLSEQGLFFLFQLTLCLTFVPKIGWHLFGTANRPSRKILLCDSILSSGRHIMRNAVCF